MSVIATTPESHQPVEHLALLLRIALRKGYHGSVGVTCHLRDGRIEKIDEHRHQVHRPEESIQ